MNKVVRWFYDIIRAKGKDYMLSNLDSKKIAYKINELTRLYGGVWTEVQGLFAVTQAEAKAEGVSFNPAVGIIMKLFINSQTGEIKMFPANGFE